MTADRVSTRLRDSASWWDYLADGQVRLVILRRNWEVGGYHELTFIAATEAECERLEEEHGMESGREVGEAVRQARTVGSARAGEDAVTAQVRALHIELAQAHARIDALRDERDMARVAHRRGRRLPLACSYCGAPRRKGVVACRAHADLVRLDAFYTEPGRVAA